MTASARVAEELDLDKIGKPFAGANYPPDARFLQYDIRDSQYPRSMKVTIHRSGLVRVTGGRTEEEALRILSWAREILERKVRLSLTFKFQIEVRDNRVYYGRGIRIESIPDVIPDSIYLNMGPASGGEHPEDSKPAPSGKYNRGGMVSSVTSSEEADRAISEVLTGGPSGGTTPRNLLGLLGSLDVADWCTHIACCRLPKSSLGAMMPRSLDRRGDIALTGLVVFTVAGSIAQLSLAKSELLELFSQNNLFCPLTPLDQIPAEVQNHAPGAFDYYATDPKFSSEQNWTTVP